MIEAGAAIFDLHHERPGVAAHGDVKAAIDVIAVFNRVSKPFTNGYLDVGECLIDEPTALGELDDVKTSTTDGLTRLRIIPTIRRSIGL
jgi:hypothetical protein